jgi:CBS domain-containing protein
VVPFSRLRRFDVVDDAGERTRLVDCAVDLLDGDDPPVTRIYVRGANRSVRALPGSAVTGLDTRARALRVASLDAARDLGEDEFGDPTLVLVGRDVLDALVLDLENRRATRANDLALEEQSGKLVLRAADVSMRALVRRLTLGRLGGRPTVKNLYDWKYVEFLRGDADAVRNGAGYHLRITRLPPGEIAGLATAIPYRHAAELLKLLPDPLAASTLAVLAPDRQLQLLEELDVEEASRLLARVGPDVAADLVGRLLPEHARDALEHLPPDRRECVVELLRYPEDTVGGIMTNDIVSARADWTVKETRARLRKRLQEPDFIFFVYVIADEETRRLRGVLRLRDLIVADDDAVLEELMNPYVVALDPLEAAAVAAYRLVDSHLVALPVVGADMRLLGAVTVDAAISAVAPSAWRAQAPRIFS